MAVKCTQGKLPEVPGAAASECFGQAGPLPSAPFPPGYDLPRSKPSSRNSEPQTPLLPLPDARERLQPSFEDSGGTAQESAGQARVHIHTQTPTNWGTWSAQGAFLGCRSSRSLCGCDGEAPSLHLTSLPLGGAVEPLTPQVLRRLRSGLSVASRVSTMMESSIGG